MRRAKFFQHDFLEFVPRQTVGCIVPSFVSLGRPPIKCTGLEDASNVESAEIVGATALS
ncbi:hypothetical protein HanRHA438_Chr06g0280961 [Helianthus annuus]|nr:hypothetical protein HanPI659440_Chr06g0246811 [Helianthus annuus]KAJ0913035.1 hypothetical protein HanRHA438_Chr06g0280961 [Helianthus annuus]